MAYWKPLEIDGNRFPLDHLEPFSFCLIPKGMSETAVINVRFHDHCFTETFSQDRHSTPIITSQSSRHEQRAFCPIRYEHSKTLRGLIEALDGKRITQTREANLVRVESTNGGNYGIFFTLRKDGRMCCSLFVVSAYPFERTEMVVAATGEMKFNVAVALVLQGKPVRFPNRR